MSFLNSGNSALKNFKVKALSSQTANSSFEAEPRISRFIKLSLHLYENTYGKLPPIIIDAKTNTQETYIQATIHNTRKNMVCETLIWLFGIVSFAFCAILLFEQFNLKPSIGMTLAQTLFCLIMGNGLVAILAGMYIWRACLPTVNFMNQLLRNDLLIKYKFHKSQFDMPGFLLLCTILLLIFLYAPLPIFVYYLNLNPVQIFLEIHFMKEKAVRSTLENILASVFSTVMFTGFICVAAKILYVCGILYLMFNTGVHGYIGSLSNINDFKFSNQRKLLTGFKNLELLDKLTRKLISYFFITALGWALLFLTMCAWVSTHGIKLLPVFVVAPFFLTLIVGILVAEFLLQDAAKCRISSFDLIKRMRSRYHTFNRSNGGKYKQYLEWKARQPYSMYFGPRFVIGEGSCMFYMSVLRDNITNSVLLFVP